MFPHWDSYLGHLSLHSASLQRRHGFLSWGWTVKVNKAVACRDKNIQWDVWQWDMHTTGLCGHSQGIWSQETRIAAWIWWDRRQCLDCTPPMRSEEHCVCNIAQCPPVKQLQTEDKQTKANSFTTKKIWATCCQHLSHQTVYLPVTYKACLSFICSENIISQHDIATGHPVYTVGVIRRAAVWWAGQVWPVVYGAHHPQRNIDWFISQSTDSEHVTRHLSCS